MNAVPLLMSVTLMLSVKIHVAPTAVSVKLDLLELDAMVGMNSFPARVFRTYLVHSVES